MPSSFAPGAPRTALSTVMLCLAACWCLWSPAQGRDSHAGDFVFERLADHLGGRQATVYDIVEDPFGFVWFAGDTDGVLRFDGHELMSWTDGFIDNRTRANVSTVRVSQAGRLWVGSWGNGLQYWDPAAGRYVQFLADPDQPHALAADRVQRLMIDSSNRLWVGTTAGINLIDADAAEGMIRLAYGQAEHPLHDERIWGMVEHHDGYWLATSSGVYRLSGDLAQWQRLLLDEAAAELFERGAEVRTITLAHGRIWAGSPQGAFLWDPVGERFERIPFPARPDRPMPRVNAIVQSRSGSLWVGAHDGLYRVDPEIPAFVLQGEEYNLIPDVDVRSLFEDGEGNLWIGSRDQGIIHGQRRDRVFEALAGSLPPELRASASRLTSAVLHDRDGRLWLGIPGGLLRRDGDGHWRQWRFDAAAGVRRVDRIREDADGRLWIATDSGLFRIDEADQLIAETRIFDLLGIAVLPVTDLIADADGALWLALWHFGVVRWHPGHEHVAAGLEALRQTRGDLVYHLSRDRSGTLWASTRYSGLFRLSQDSWEAVLPEGQQRPPSIYCVHHDPTGLLWLCTEDGLLQFDPVSGEQRLLGIEHGLPTSRVTGLFFDRHDILWVMTPQGMARRIPDSNRFVSYGLADGLPGLGLQRNAVDIGVDGRIVLGTTEGAAVLDPDRAPRGLDAPRTVLSRLWLDGTELTRQINPARIELLLDPDHRDLMVQFAVLDFHEPERNLARYRLRGFDAQFSDLSANRVIRYMNLPPGAYQLEIEGWSSRGVPSAQTLNIPIRVKAPWWHSPWSWLVFGLLLAVLIWLTVQLRLRALKRSNDRLQRLIDARTRELEQVNERLQAQSARDFLTGLLNRRGLTSEFQVMERLASRQPGAMSLILFDLDHFKQINDRFGHETGDEILRQIGRILSRTLRSPDMAARWGGEEFLIVLPNTDLNGALQVCEKLRLEIRAIAGAGLPPDLQASATFGVASGQIGEHTLEAWVRQADRALYAGKQGGRDRIVATPADPV